MDRWLLHCRARHRWNWCDPGSCFLDWDGDTRLSSETKKVELKMKRMKTPVIDGLVNTGTSLIATIWGPGVKLTTFRGGLWAQGRVLPPPFTQKCPLFRIFTDPNDDESDLVEVERCILDREVAHWTKRFAQGV